MQRPLLHVPFYNVLSGLRICGDDHVEWSRPTPNQHQPAWEGSVVRIVFDRLPIRQGVSHVVVADATLERMFTISAE